MSTQKYLQHLTVFIKVHKSLIKVCGVNWLHYWASEVLLGRLRAVFPNSLVFLWCWTSHLRVYGPKTLKCSSWFSTGRFWLAGLEYVERDALQTNVGLKDCPLCAWGMRAAASMWLLWAFHSRHRWGCKCHSFILAVMNTGLLKFVYILKRKLTTWRILFSVSYTVQSWGKEKREEEHMRWRKHQGGSSNIFLLLLLLLRKERNQKWDALVICFISHLQHYAHYFI